MIRTWIFPLVFLTFSFTPFVSAQFQFFDQMFGHPQQHQQHQQRTGASQWAAHSDSGTVKIYHLPWDPPLNLTLTPHSRMLALPLPSDARMCSQPSGVSVSRCAGCEVHDTRCGRGWGCYSCMCERREGVCWGGAVVKDWAPEKEMIIPSESTEWLHAVTIQYLRMYCSAAVMEYWSEHCHSSCACYR